MDQKWKRTGQLLAIGIAVWAVTAVILTTSKGLTREFIVPLAGAIVCVVGAWAWAVERFILAGICLVSASILVPWGYGNVLGRPVALGLAVTAILSARGHPSRHPS
jgi:hypothetical protein